jgi:very-short-patch-repair endonuclease
VRLFLPLPSGERVGVRGCVSRILVNARELRRRSTATESKLWYHLRSRRLEGARFRRQHPIGSRIADFYCAEARLVIELDGGGHGDPVQVQADVRRDEEFEKRGLRVLPFWNTYIHGIQVGVLSRISEALKCRPSP